MKRYVIVFVAILGIAGVSRAQEEASSETVRKADSTIAALSIVLKHNPKDGPSLHGVANAYYDLEKWDSAMTFYRAYLKDNPQDTNARVDYSWTIYAHDPTALDESRRELDTVLAQNPHMYNALYNYGLLITKAAEGRGELTETDRNDAMRYFTEALKEARKSHQDAVENIESILYELEHPR